LFLACAPKARPTHAGADFRHVGESTTGK